MIFNMENFKWFYSTILYLTVSMTSSQMSQSEILVVFILEDDLFVYQDKYSHSNSFDTLKPFISFPKANPFKMSPARQMPCIKHVRSKMTSAVFIEQF